MSVKNPVAKKIPGNFCFSGWHKVENEQGRKLKWGSLGCCYPEYGPAAWASPGMLARNLESQASLQTHWFQLYLNNIPTDSSTHQLS